MFLHELHYSYMYNNYVHVLTFPGTMPSMNTSLSSESLLDEIEKSRSKLQVFVISRNGSLSTEQLVQGVHEIMAWLGSLKNGLSGSRSRCILNT